MYANGQICFGLTAIEFPWNEEPWCGDFEEWWRDVNGYKNPVLCPYTDNGSYKPGIEGDDSSIDEYYDYRWDWDKANPPPIDLVGYPDGWILAVPSSTMIESGYPEAFDPALLVVLDEERQSLLAFCKKWEITISVPQWWLSTYYS